MVGLSSCEAGSGAISCQFLGPWPAGPLWLAAVWRPPFLRALSSAKTSPFFFGARCLSAVCWRPRHRRCARCGAAAPALRCPLRALLLLGAACGSAWLRSAPCSTVPVLHGCPRHCARSVTAAP